MARGTVLTIELLASVVFAASIVIPGIYFDRLGRRNVVLGSCVLSVPWAFLLLPLLDSGSTAAFAIGLLVTLSVTGISCGPA